MRDPSQLPLHLSPSGARICIECCSAGHRCRRRGKWDVNRLCDSAASPVPDFQGFSVWMLSATLFLCGSALPACLSAGQYVSAWFRSGFPPFPTRVGISHWRSNMVAMLLARAEFSGFMPALASLLLIEAASPGRTSRDTSPVRIGATV